MKMGMSVLLALCMVMSGIMLAAPAGSRDVGTAASALTPHAPIRIDSDADFDAAHGVNNTATGNGTVWAPWIVEDWDIDGTSVYSYSISVGNTTEHFIIRECHLYGARSGIYLNNTVNGTIFNNTFNTNQMAINCANASKAAIIQNTVNGTGGNGIFLQDGTNNITVTNNTVSYASYGMLMAWSLNNTIANNTIEGTVWYGIILPSDSHNNTFRDNHIDSEHYGIDISANPNPCSNNVFFGNTIFDCAVTGIHCKLGSHDNLFYHNTFINNIADAEDLGTNQWDIGYPGGGNHWDNYTGIDANSDGIGDVPQLFSGGTDRYPLMAPFTGQPLGEFVSPGSIGHSPNGLGVPVDATFSIEWNETMNWTSVEESFSYADNVTVWNSTNGTWAHDAGTNASVFTPTDPLHYSTEYVVCVNITATDLVGNALDQDGNGTGGEWPSDVLTWNFTTVTLDLTPPIALNHSPNGTGIAPDAAIIVNWSETMNWASVEAAFSYTDGTLNFTSANGTWAHDPLTNVSTFTPADDLAFEAQYFITVNCTSTDMAGNMLGQDGDGTGGEWPSDVLSWNFTVTDEAPWVISTTPANGQVDVDPNKPLKVVFSERMNITSVETAFSFTNATIAWTAADGVVYWNAEQTEFTFSPVEPLPTNQTFDAVLEGALACDYGGKALGGDYAWSFRTWKEPPAPHVIDTYPPSGATNVNVNTYINMAFDSEMDTATTEAAFSYTDGVNVWTAVNGTVDWFSDNTLMSFQPAQRLNFDSTYTVIMGSNATSIYGKNLDGNDNGVPDPIDNYAFTFATSLEPPIVASYYPADGQMDLPASIPAIYLNFSKVMNEISVMNSVSIYPATAFTPSFSGSGMNLTLVLAADLLEGQPYRVTVLGTAVDQLGVKLDGNNDGWAGDKFTFSFSTKGVVQPTRPHIVNIFPPNNSTVPVDVFSVTITFNVAMNKTSVQEGFTFRNSTATINGTFLWSTTGTNVKFTPTEALEYNMTYFAGLSGASRDLSGLTLGNNTIWQYKTEMEDAPKPVMDWIIYGVIIFLVMMVGVLYMANRSLRRDLKRTRVKLKRLKREMGIEETKDAPVDDEIQTPTEETPPDEEIEKK